MQQAPLTGVTAGLHARLCVLVLILVCEDMAMLGSNALHVDL